MAARQIAGRLAISTVERTSHLSTPDRSRPQVFRTKHQDTLEPTTRIVTPTRVVALGLIAVLIAGLVYARFAPETGPVAVPEGAGAGELILEPCEYPTENGSRAADCGTLVVPETRADPESTLIALPVTRIRAMSDDPNEPIFFPHRRSRAIEY